MGQAWSGVGAQPPKQPASQPASPASTAAVPRWLSAIPSCTAPHTRGRSTNGACSLTGGSAGGTRRRRRPARTNRPPSSRRPTAPPQLQVWYICMRQYKLRLALQCACTPSAAFDGGESAGGGRRQRRRRVAHHSMAPTALQLQTEQGPQAGCAAQARVAAAGAPRCRPLAAGAACCCSLPPQTASRG